tara:strand:- start:857 stop:1006 length:150 start_codon:yes stop_codon:yes gene_type:complete
MSQLKIPHHLLTIKITNDQIYKGQQHHSIAKIGATVYLNWQEWRAGLEK